MRYSTKSWGREKWCPHSGVWKSLGFSPQKKFFPRLVCVCRMSVVPILRCYSVASSSGGEVGALLYKASQSYTVPQLQGRLGRENGVHNGGATQFSMHPLDWARVSVLEVILVEKLTWNQSCRARQGLQELLKGIFPSKASLACKTQNTFWDAAVLSTK